MRAMRLHSIGVPLVADEVAVPEPGPLQVLLQVKACGVCRTDLHLLDGELPDVRCPITPGHEIVGTVDALGPEVTRWRVGDRIGVPWLAHTCGVCRFCTSGRENLCLDPRFTGWDVDGGYADFALVEEAYAYALPDSFDDVEAAPLLCAGIIGYRALLRANLPERGRLGIYGFGGSAHITAQIALARGARVHVMTRSTEAQALALELGAASAGDAAATVRELVPADRESAAGALFPLGGVTWAFDCVGHPAVLRSALDCLDWGGNAVAIGIPPRGTEVAVDVNALAYVDRGLLGCRYGSARPHHDIPLMVDLYRTGQLMLDELVSLTRPLDRFGEVIDEMHAGRVARGVLLFD